MRFDRGDTNAAARVAPAEPTDRTLERLTTSETPTAFVPNFRPVEPTQAPLVGTMDEIPTVVAWGEAGRVPPTLQTPFRDVRTFARPLTITPTDQQMLVGDRREPLAMGLPVPQPLPLVTPAEESIPYQDLLMQVPARQQEFERFADRFQTRSQVEQLVSSAVRPEVKQQIANQLIDQTRVLLTRALPYAFPSDEQGGLPAAVVGAFDYARYVQDVLARSLPDALPRFHQAVREAVAPFLTRFAAEPAIQSYRFPIETPQGRYEIELPLAMVPDMGRIESVEPASIEEEGRLRRAVASGASPALRATASHLLSLLPQRVAPYRPLRYLIKNVPQPDGTRRDVVFKPDRLIESVWGIPTRARPAVPRGLAPHPLDGFEATFIENANEVAELIDLLGDQFLLVFERVPILIVSDPSPSVVAQRAVWLGAQGAEIQLSPRPAILVNGRPLDAPTGNLVFYTSDASVLTPTALRLLEETYLRATNDPAPPVLIIAAPPMPTGATVADPHLVAYDLVARTMMRTLTDRLVDEEVLRYPQRGLLNLPERVITSRSVAVAGDTLVFRTQQTAQAPQGDETTVIEKRIPIAVAREVGETIDPSAVPMVRRAERGRAPRRAPAPSVQESTQPLRVVATVQPEASLEQHQLLTRILTPYEIYRRLLGAPPSTQLGRASTQKRGRAEQPTGTPLKELDAEATNPSKEVVFLQNNAPVEPSGGYKPEAVTYHFERYRQIAKTIRTQTIPSDPSEDNLKIQLNTLLNQRYTETRGQYAQPFSYIASLDGILPFMMMRAKIVNEMGENTQSVYQMIRMAAMTTPLPYLFRQPYFQMFQDNLPSMVKPFTIATYQEGTQSLEGVANKQLETLRRELQQSGISQMFHITSLFYFTTPRLGLDITFQRPHDTATAQGTTETLMRHLAHVAKAAMGRWLLSEGLLPDTLTRQPSAWMSAVLTQRETLMAAIGIKQKSVTPKQASQVLTEWITKVDEYVEKQGTNALRVLESAGIYPKELMGAITNADSAAHQQLTKQLLFHFLLMSTTLQSLQEIQPRTANLALYNAYSTGRKMIDAFRLSAYLLDPFVRLHVPFGTELGAGEVVLTNNVVVGYQGSLADYYYRLAQAFDAIASDQTPIAGLGNDDQTVLKVLLILVEAEAAGEYLTLTEQAQRAESFTAIHHETTRHERELLFRALATFTSARQKMGISAQTVSQLTLAEILEALQPERLEGLTKALAAYQAIPMTHPFRKVMTYTAMDARQLSQFLDILVGRYIQEHLSNDAKANEIRQRLPFVAGARQLGGEGTEPLLRQEETPEIGSPTPQRADTLTETASRVDEMLQQTRVAPITQLSNPQDAFQTDLGDYGGTYRIGVFPSNRAQPIAQALGLELQTERMNEEGQPIVSLYMTKGPLTDTIDLFFFVTTPPLATPEVREQLAAERKRHILSILEEQFSPDLSYKIVVFGDKNGLDIVSSAYALLTQEQATITDQHQLVVFVPHGDKPEEQQATKDRIASFFNAMLRPPDEARESVIQDVGAEAPQRRKYEPNELTRENGGTVGQTQSEDTQQQAQKIRLALSAMGRFHQNVAQVGVPQQIKELETETEESPTAVLTSAEQRRPIRNVYLPLGNLIVQLVTSARFRADFTSEQVEELLVRAFWANTDSVPVLLRRYTTVVDEDPAMRIAAQTVRIQIGVGDAAPTIEVPLDTAAINAFQFYFDPNAYWDYLATSPTLQRRQRQQPTGGTSEGLPNHETRFRTLMNTLVAKIYIGARDYPEKKANQRRIQDDDRRTMNAWLQNAIARALGVDRTHVGRNAVIEGLVAGMLSNDWFAFRKLKPIYAQEILQIAAEDGEEADLLEDYAMGMQSKTAITRESYTLLDFLVAYKAQQRNRDLESQEITDIARKLHQLPFQFIRGVLNGQFNAYHLQDLAEQFLRELKKFPKDTDEYNAKLEAIESALTFVMEYAPALMFVSLLAPIREKGEQMFTRAMAEQAVEQRKTKTDSGELTNEGRAWESTWETFKRRVKYARFNSDGAILKPRVTERQDEENDYSEFGIAPKGFAFRLHGKLLARDENGNLVAEEGLKVISAKRLRTLTSRVLLFITLTRIADAVQSNHHDPLIKWVTDLLSPRRTIMIGARDYGDAHTFTAFMGARALMILRSLLSQTIQRYALAQSEQQADLPEITPETLVGTYLVPIVTQTTNESGLTEWQPKNRAAEIARDEHRQAIQLIQQVLFEMHGNPTDARYSFVGVARGTNLRPETENALVTLLEAQPKAEDITQFLQNDETLFLLANVLTHMLEQDTDYNNWIRNLFFNRVTGEGSDFVSLLSTIASDNNRYSVWLNQSRDKTYEGTLGRVHQETNPLVQRLEENDKKILAAHPFPAGMEPYGLTHLTSASEYALKYPVQQAIVSAGIVGFVSEAELLREGEDDITESVYYWIMSRYNDYLAQNGRDGKEQASPDETLALVQLFVTRTTTLPEPSLAVKIAMDQAFRFGQKVAREGKVLLVPNLRPIHFAAALGALSVRDNHELRILVHVPDHMRDMSLNDYEMKAYGLLLKVAERGDPNYQQARRNRLVRISTFKGERTGEIYFSTKLHITARTMASLADTMVVYSANERTFLKYNAPLPQTIESADALAKYKTMRVKYREDGETKEDAYPTVIARKFAVDSQSYPTVMAALARNKQTSNANEQVGLVLVTDHARFYTAQPDIDALRKGGLLNEAEIGSIRSALEGGLTEEVVPITAGYPSILDMLPQPQRADTQKSFAELLSVQDLKSLPRPTPLGNQQPKILIAFQDKVEALKRRVIERLEAIANRAPQQQEGSAEATEVTIQITGTHTTPVKPIVSITIGDQTVSNAYDMKLVPSIPNILEFLQTTLSDRTPTRIVLRPDQRIRGQTSAFEAFVNALASRYAGVPIETQELSQEGASPQSELGRASRQDRRFKTIAFPLFVSNNPRFVISAQHDAWKIMPQMSISDEESITIYRILSFKSEGQWSSFRLHPDIFEVQIEMYPRAESERVFPKQLEVYTVNISELASKRDHEFRIPNWKIRLLTQDRNYWYIEWVYNGSLPTRTGEPNDIRAVLVINKDGMTKFWAKEETISFKYDIESNKAPEGEIEGEPMEPEYSTEVREDSLDEEMKPKGIVAYETVDLNELDLLVESILGLGIRTYQGIRNGEITTVLSAINHQSIGVIGGKRLTKEETEAELGEGHRAGIVVKYTSDAVVDDRYRGTFPAVDFTLFAAAQEEDPHNITLKVVRKLFYPHNPEPFVDEGKLTFNLQKLAEQNAPHPNIVGGIPSQLPGDQTASLGEETPPHPTAVFEFTPNPSIKQSRIAPPGFLIDYFDPRYEKPSSLITVYGFVLSAQEYKRIQSELHEFNINHNITYRFRAPFVKWYLLFPSHQGDPIHLIVPEVQLFLDFIPTDLGYESRSDKKKERLLSKLLRQQPRRLVEHQQRSSREGDPPFEIYRFEKNFVLMAQQPSPDRLVFLTRAGWTYRRYVILNKGNQFVVRYYEDPTIAELLAPTEQRIIENAPVPSYRFERIGNSFWWFHTTESSEETAQQGYGNRFTLWLFEPKEWGFNRPPVLVEVAIPVKPDQPIQYQIVQRALPSPEPTDQPPSPNWWASLLTRARDLFHHPQPTQPQPPADSETLLINAVTSAPAPTLIGYEPMQHKLIAFFQTPYGQLIALDATYSPDLNGTLVNTTFDQTAIHSFLIFRRDDQILVHILDQRIEKPLQTDLDAIGKYQRIGNLILQLHDADDQYLIYKAWIYHPPQSANKPLSVVPLLMLVPHNATQPVAFTLPDQLLFPNLTKQPTPPNQKDERDERIETLEQEIQQAIHQEPLNKDQLPLFIQNLIQQPPAVVEDYRLIPNGFRYLFSNNTTATVHLITTTPHDRTRLQQLPMPTEHYTPGTFDNLPAMTLLDIQTPTRTYRYELHRIHNILALYPYPLTTQNQPAQPQPFNGTFIPADDTHTLYILNDQLILTPTKTTDTYTEYTAWIYNPQTPQTPAKLIIHMPLEPYKPIEVYPPEDLYFRL